MNTSLPHRLTQMISSRVAPVNEPRRFEPHELFISLTDAKGRIRYGNRVFTRVAGYTEEELIDQPHSIIRHPDMPRCVFRLLWDYVEAGKTIAAYVKNLASDGRYYWVLAVVTPSRDGYLSVRLNPSTDYFAAAKKLYGETLKMESSVECIDGKQKAIEQSLPFLAEQLAAAGFPNYDTFMRTALRAELSAREQFVDAESPPEESASPQAAELRQLHGELEQLIGRLDEVFRSLDVFESLSSRLAVKHAAMAELAPSLNILALNAHIAASRLGDEGAVLSVVSRSLGERSKEADHLIGKLMDRMQPVCDTARGVAFDVEVAQIEAQVCEAFVRELLETQTDHPSPGVLGSLDALIVELRERTAKLLGALNRLGGDIDTMVNATRDLVSRVEQMKVAQMNGKIDVASRPNAQSFHSTFADIAKIVEEAREDCGDAIELLTTTRLRLNELLETEAALTHSLQLVDRHTNDIVVAGGLGESPW